MCKLNMFLQNIKGDEALNSAANKSADKGYSATTEKMTKIHGISGDYFL